VVWVGCIGLVVMGGLLLRQLPRLSLTPARPSDHAGAGRQRAQARPGEGVGGRAWVAFQGGPVAAGAFFSLTSPGFLVWWATIGASVLLEGTLAGVPGIAMVASGHALADVSWCWFLAFSVERGRAYCFDRTYRTIVGLIALCLIALGVGLPLKHYL
jgi:threonine/homoserine/homoserine lactone efflux protein